MSVPPKLYSAKPARSHLEVLADTMPLRKHWKDGVSEPFSSGRKKRKTNSYTQRKKRNKQSGMFTNPHPRLLGIKNLTKMRGSIIYYMKSKKEKVAAQTR